MSTASPPSIVRLASMGPGRLTGMNVASRVGRSHLGEASMGPGRLTGMNGGWRGGNRAGGARASMGPGRLTGMNAPSGRMDETV